jgi:hypothetical protein
MAPDPGRVPITSEGREAVISPAVTAMVGVRGPSCRGQHIADSYQRFGGGDAEVRRGRQA